ncbi:MAG: hypothetical protein CVV59_01875 [Tenericutes bacterium HGW-Tenericutes-4]|nr:MAG: hypothetical protein CVV59_01875 [Tenericutes bacterium HGW-Tenericutes-4]
MFSAKLFNQITIALVIIFFLSATISTITDIQQENNIRLQFTELLQEVNGFNSTHSNYVSMPTPEEPETNYESLLKDGKEALVAGFSNYKTANSYYSEAYGKMSFSALNFPLEVEFWIKNIQYSDGDFVQEIVAKEVGTLFGGKKASMVVYYKKTDNLVYRNFTWTVNFVQNKWVASYNNNWTKQALANFIIEFDVAPGTSIYEVTSKTAFEELYYQNVIGVGNKTKEHHIQYKLNPSLSTKAYKGFLSYVLNFIEEDFVKSVSFKELTVSAIVDANSYLSMSKYKERFGFSVFIRQWGNITISGICSSEMTYMYMLFNQDIPYEKPNIR